MIKRVLIAAACIVASPEFLFAQGEDIFFSFSDSSVQTAAMLESGSSGSAFIFARSGFAGATLDFNAADLSISSSTNSLLLTGGVGVGGTIPDPAEPGLTIPETPNLIGGSTFDNLNSVAVTINSESEGRFAVAGILGSGINPAFAGLDPTNFVADVGFLIGQVDFTAGDAGSATLSLAEFPDGGGIVNLPATALENVTFGSATLTSTSAIPEPTSAVLLVLGSCGLATVRRRKS